MKKFLICTPSYNPNNGGVIALHKLCHLINLTGREAYLHQLEHNYEFNRFTYKKILYRYIKDQIRGIFKKYKTHSAFNTPKLKNLSKLNLDEWIIIYPEITFGNPLNSKNTVRWLLHNPGFHTKKIYYQSNELYFKFNSAISDFSFPGSTTSSHELKVVHYPTEYYNLTGTSKERHGTAYCIRKGAGKKIIHDTTNSTLIDHLDHQTIAKIFKSVKTFISYDTYTAYSIFATLCGCESIVIPDEGVTEDTWYPNLSDRYGIAYGFENLAKAQLTKDLVFDHIIKEEEKSKENVGKFIYECDKFFSAK